MGETLEAGRELDALVAEKAMGWVWMRDRSLGPNVVFLFSPARVAMMLEKHVADNRVTGPIDTPPPASLPHYSTDIAASWKVVEKLDADGFYVSVDRLRDGAGRCWQAEAARLTNETDEGFCDEDTRWGASADTVPLAICLAALAASGVAPQEGTHGRE